MEIKQYTALIWRWAWLIIVGVVVAGATAYVVSKNSARVYSASARLLVDEAPGSSSGNDYSQVLLEQRLTQTYLEIMKTEPVLQETIDLLNLADLESKSLAGMVSVSAPQDTQILNVTVQDIDPDRAAAIANTLSQVFIEQNQERDALRYAEPIANWQARADELADEIQSLENQINGMGDAETAEAAAALSRLQTQLNGAQIQYTEAFNNLNQLQVDQARESSNLIIIEEAQPNRNPIRPRTSTNTLLAAVVGGMLALGVVFLIEYLDDTVKTPDQIQEDTGLSTLGAIAQINAKTDNLSERLITQITPRDPISEAYRILRTNLSFSAVDGGLSSLLVTSASPGEGKSTTAANLAVVLSQTGQKVIILDADLRRPTQHKIFGVANNQGLTTAILDPQTPLSYHLQKTKVPGLQIMASGPIPPNPAELLNSQRMAHLLETLKEEADIVVFDTPPVLTVADAAILAPQVDGAVLVVEAGKVKRAALQQAVDRLIKANAVIFGAVVNLLRTDRGGYYNYHYYYHYYNAYEQDNKKKRSRRRNKQSRLPEWLSSGFSRR